MRTYYGKRAQTIILCVVCIRPILAVDVKGYLAPSDVCPDISSIGRAQVALDHGTGYYAGVRSDSTFHLRDVEEGTYVLSVVAHDFMFDQILLQITSNDSSVPPAVLPYIAGTPISQSSSPIRLPYPISLSPKRKNGYYVPHEAFDLLGMFRNPMMLLMVFAGIMVFASPYLMKNMDPEAARDMQERHASVASMQSSLENLDIGGGLANWLSGSEVNNSQQKLVTGNGRVKSVTTNSKSRPMKGRRK